MRHIAFFSLAFSCVLFAAAKCPDIIPRSEWGASPPKKIRSTPKTPEYVIIHHTVEPTACYTMVNCIKAVKSIQTYHQNTKKWSDIGYNFVIGGDGNIYEGVGWGRVGAHAIGYNSKSIGISLIGDYSNVAPPQSMVDQATALIQCSVTNGKLSANYKLLGHRQVGQTECPGNKLYNMIKNLPNYKPNVN